MVEAQGRRRRRRLTLLLSVAILVGLAVRVSVSAVAAEPDYIFCEATEARKVTYYSSVFEGDYSRSARYKLDFHSYVSGDLGGKPLFSDTYCFFAHTESEAKAKRSRSMEGAREAGRGVNDTRWKP